MPLTLAALVGAAVLIVLVPIASSMLALIGTLTAAELTLRACETLTSNDPHMPAAPRLPSRS